ncbi:hypothetical protein [Bifidobacterium vansinderenii]|uniref:Uncharacterized protein n=1 Tax=Bifidobacterium vansinderenii TaxID=1984871 RepID=A0A229W1C2_9BIFI|nr:hypothetical protein [Bifidobacterium vansinderenii]OXN01659.1 hypothetical protein Tam10B_0101 [Bifidobacterium vansinderenii]
MGAGLEGRPKSLIVLHLWLEHRAALQYDWIRAWGCPLDLKAMPLYAAWPMLWQILMDHSSHSYAALAGYAWIPDPADKYIHAYNQGMSKIRIRPPWQTTVTQTDPAKPKRPHDERLRRRLKDRLGITE